MYFVVTEILRTDKFKVRNSVRVYGTKKRTDQGPFFMVFDSLAKLYQHMVQALRALYIRLQQCLVRKF